MLCKKDGQSIDHVVSGCSKFPQKEYRGRDVNLHKKVH